MEREMRAMCGVRCRAQPERVLGVRSEYILLFVLEAPDDPCRGDDTDRRFLSVVVYNCTRPE